MMRLSAQNRKVAGARDPSERQRQRTKEPTADRQMDGTDRRTGRTDGWKDRRTKAEAEALE